MALIDLADIVQAVVDQLKLDSTNTSETDRIKSDINLVYVDEVVPFKRWKWLTGNVDLVHSAFYTGGTVAVTPNSTTITFSVAPDASQAGKLFAVEDFNEIYTISSHTAASTTATLTSAYNGDLDAAASFKTWTNRVNLPIDCRETVEVYHDFYNKPLEPKGRQEFRRLSLENPRLNGRPYFYSTVDYEDPTPLTDETESDRYRQMLIHPSITSYNTTLHIDYVREVTPLTDDADEPLMPKEDRVVLVYGALERAWDRARVPEMAEKNRARFDQKLSLMSGRVEDSYDKPQVTPDSSYMLRKRGKAGGPSSRLMALSSGGSYSAPTYLASVTINGAVITGDVTVNSGITIDGRDISVDGAALDALGALDSGKIFVGNASNVSVGVTPTGDVTISNAGVTAITADSIVDADVNSAAAIAYSKLNLASSIVNNDVSASAAIAKTKIAAGTASRVEVTDGSGLLVESAITATELTYLDDVEALTPATLTDNTSSAAAVAVWALASFDSISLNYTLKRGASNKEMGIINIVTDGTNAAIAQGAIASLGTLGVTFTVDVSGTDVRLLYTTTSTGTDATIHYKVNKWLA